MPILKDMIGRDMANASSVPILKDLIAQDMAKYRALQPKDVIAQDTGSVRTLSMIASTSVPASSSGLGFMPMELHGNNVNTAPTYPLYLQNMHHPWQQNQQYVSHCTYAPLQQPQSSVMLYPVAVSSLPFMLVSEQNLPAQSGPLTLFMQMGPR